MPAVESIPVTPVLSGQVERLYQHHHPMILRTAFRITRDWRDAEDVLHGIFVRLMTRGESLPPEADPGPYLHRAAVNLALDILRKRQRNGPTEAFGPAIVSGGPSPEDESRRRELGDRLRAAVARLSPRAAEIFILRHVEGCSNLDISRMLGISWSVVAVTLFRARHRLQKELQSGKGE